MQLLANAMNQIKQFIQQAKNAQDQVKWYVERYNNWVEILNTAKEKCDLDYKKLEPIDPEVLKNLIDCDVEKLPTIDIEPEEKLFINISLRMKRLQYVTVFLLSSQFIF